MGRRKSYKNRCLRPCWVGAIISGRCQTPNFGTFKGEQASNYLRNLGNTFFNTETGRIEPSEASFFNKKEGRYVYTENGGWIDMVHFLFYAGRAYKYKLQGDRNPVGKALMDGLGQEMSDLVLAPHSAFSYEDLPSDLFGAEFGANYFDPNSDLTFGEQVENYLNDVLKATDPQNAPNYVYMPASEPDRPTRINLTPTPVYTQDNP
jgi:hypothetical protein